MFIEKLFWSFLDFMNLTVCSKPLPRLALLHNVFVGIAVCNFSIILENVLYLFGQAVKFAVSFLQILQLQLLSWKKRHGILWNQRNSLQCYCYNWDVAGIFQSRLRWKFQVGPCTSLIKSFSLTRIFAPHVSFETQESKANKYVLFNNSCQIMIRSTMMFA